MQITILNPFIKEPWRKFTLTEIKAITKNKSHHYVYEALKKFAEKGIITEDKKGNTNLYSINPENRNPNPLAAAEYEVKEQRQDIPYKILDKITARIKIPFYTLLIGGSYAESKQRPTSDLDIAFIIPDSENKKTYQLALKEGELTIPEVHGYVFTQEEFMKMLLNEEFNYGKELARKHIIHHGAEPYYELLFEAMKNGFKGGHVPEESKDRD